MKMVNIQNWKDLSRKQLCFPLFIICIEPDEKLKKSYKKYDYILRKTDHTIYVDSIA